MATKERARWTIVRTGYSVSLRHSRLDAGEEEDLGTLDAAVDDNAVLEWISEHARANSGDEVRTSSGDLLVIRSDGLELRHAQLTDGRVIFARHRTFA